MKRIWFLIPLVFLACTQDPSDGEEAVTDENAPQVGEITHIETLFDETSFPDQLHQRLLLELQICDTLPAQVSGCSPCTPRYFKLHAFKRGVKLEDAFLVQIRALSVLKGQNVQLPVRHLLAFERENGSLVKVNGFRGNLIGLRESASGVKDLIIRFYLPDDDAFVNCLFEWKDGKYKYTSVEAIDGAGGSGAVKAELKDSISNLIYQDLMSNGMLF